MYSYEEIIKKINSGCRFEVDFKNKILKLNRKSVKYDSESIEKYDDINDWLSKLEELYYDYNYSIPSGRTKSKVYFKAKNIDEIDMKGMNAPFNREEARARLELFVLFSLVNGSFSFEKILENRENKEEWFYQSSIQKDLIINKYWF